MLRTACFILCGFATSLAIAEDGPVTLAYQFRPNQFQRYEVTHKLNVVTRVGESEDFASNESSAVKQYRVVTVDEQGIATIEPIIEQLRLQAQFGDSPPVVYDSTSGSEAPAQFEGLLQKSVGQALMHLRLSPHGELVQLLPLANVEKTDAKLDPRMNFLIPLPKQPIRVGESWKDKITVSVAVGELAGLKREVPLQRVYMLMSHKDGIAAIEFKTAALTTQTDAVMQAQLAQMLATGSIEFDTRQGMIISQSSKVDQEILGVAGKESKMRAQSTTQEKLLPTGPKVIGASGAKPLPR